MACARSFRNRSSSASIKANPCAVTKLGCGLTGHAPASWLKSSWSLPKARLMATTLHPKSTKANQMENAAPPVIRLADYKPSPYLIDEVALDFALAPEKTRVTSRLAMRPNPASKEKGAVLVLDGEELSLISIALDGTPLDPARYTLGPTKLMINDPPDRPFVLEMVGTCDPKANTQLSGLYTSSGILCTQCEAEGFRRITWYLDRPDVMARFRVRIETSKAACP